MKFIKIYWGMNGNFRVSVRTNCYNRSLAHVQEMLGELKKDHLKEEIKPEDVTIVIYDTPSFRGIMGIEYNTEHPNKTYFQVDVAPCLF